MSALNRFLGLVGLQLVHRGGSGSEIAALRSEVAGLRFKLEYGAARHQTTVRELEGAIAEMDGMSLRPSPDRAELVARLLGTGASEAFYIVSELRLSVSRDGDIAEFGVAQGATSALLASELLGTTKELWLFDSFEGLPSPTEEDVLIDDIFDLGSMEAYEGTMASPVDEVLERLRDVEFPSSRVHIVPGFIEQTLDGDNLPRRLAFAYVDLDFYRPIRLALEFLAEILVPGGSVLVDDYGHFSAGAQQAVDEFVAERDAEFRLILPKPWAGNFAILRRT